VATAPYETLSKEEASSFLYGGQPQPQMPSQQVVPQQTAPQQVVPVEPTPRKTKPIASPTIGKPVVNDLNPDALVNMVGNANKNIQQQMPELKAPSTVGALIDQLTSNWQIPVSGIGALAALGGAAYYYNKKKGLKSREINPQRIDPTLDATDLSEPTPRPVPEPVKVAEPVKEEPKTKLAIESEQKFGAPLADVEEHFGVKITNLKDAEILTNSYKNSLPKGTTPGIPSGQQNPPMTTGGAFSQPSSYKEVLPTTSTDVNPKTGIEPTPEPRPEKTTSKSSKKKTEVAIFKSEADIPKGYEFRADVGNLDRSIYNILGPEGRQYAKEVLNEGKMFGEHKGADYNQKVKEIISNYGEKLKEITPSIDLTTREGRIAVGAPHTTNYAAKGFGKPAKVAGIAGTLFAAADVVNAKTAEEKANAKNNLLGAVLPLGADILEAGAPTLNQAQLGKAIDYYKLGSPYAQTEEAKKARLKEKAGAGRGIAPPSAYMR
jgi:hypothetical protein